MSTPPAHRGRFAPSPTGPLHFGSLVAALGSWLLARQAGGEWLVRIEDLDPPREIPGAADAQLRTLAAFGLHADGVIVHQSARTGLYRQALQRLLDSGDAFECHCSRSDLAEQAGVHRTCAAAHRRTQPAIRLRVPAATRIAFEDGLQGRIEQDVAGEVGDFVLRRADGLWAYQLAVVVDDGDQGVNQVVRGADLLDSTPRQILLQQRLGLPTPAYLHLPVVVDGEGRKLSKSLAALPLDERNPLPALRAAWRFLGQAPEAVEAASSAAAFFESARAAFDLSRVPRRRSMRLDAVHNSPATDSD